MKNSMDNKGSRIGDIEMRFVCTYMHLLAGGLAVSALGALLKEAFVNHRLLWQGLALIVVGAVLSFTADSMSRRCKWSRNIGVVLAACVSWLVCSFFSKQLGIGIWAELPTAAFVGVCLSYLTSQRGRIAFAAQRLEAEPTSAA